MSEILKTAGHEIRRFPTNELVAAKLYFEEHGYVVFENAFPVAEGEAFWSELEQAIADQIPLTFSCYGQIHTNPDVPLEGFKLPRVIDAEHHLESCRNLALGPIVESFLSEIYGKAPTCLQTLAYKFSSEQGAHSDFSLVAPPHSPDYDRTTLTASWFALEDAEERNGALIIYPGSHKLSTRSIYDGFDLDYGSFSNHCMEESILNGCHPATFKARAGDVLFWHGNLVHAGGTILEPDAQPTRRSLVCHYAAVSDDVVSGNPAWARTPYAGGSYFAKTA